MKSLDQIKRCWVMPDDWVVQITDDTMEVKDADNHSVAKMMTQVKVIERINEHLEAQESWLALQLMQATFKKPIEA
tara:strand:- start:3205 stop:3432 length:228 start_codon:yes stop_codon:yes gene_type:complete